MTFIFPTLLRQLLAVGMCSLVIPYSFAENLTQFEDVLAKVERYQSQTDIWQQRQKIAELNIRQSQLWKNPSLNVTQDGFDKEQDRELSVGISQPIDIFGQRKIQQKIAQTFEQKNQLQQQLWQARSQLIVKYAWSKLALAEAEKNNFAAQLKISHSNLESAKKRYQAGSIALVDYERAQISAIENQRMYAQARLDLEVAQKYLSNLWGDADSGNSSLENSNTGTSNSETASTFESLAWPKNSDALVKSYIQKGWLEKLYALNIQQSNQQIEQLKVSAKPNPTVNLGMTRSQSATDANDTTLTLGIDIPLNIFNRQQYSIPMAQRQQSLVQQQQQLELKQQILDIANRLHQLQGLSSQFKSINEQLALAEKVQSRTLLGFQQGKLSITDVQQASTQLQTIRFSQIQVLAQAWQSALSAEALSLGTSYEQISTSNAYTQLNKDALTELNGLVTWGEN